MAAVLIGPIIKTTTTTTTRPETLYVILARHIELPEDDILDVETCRIMLFAIIVLDLIVQPLVKLQINLYNSCLLDMKYYALN
jgi:hypothetical protein